MNGGDLRALLAEGPLLADGGMGTSLIENGVPLDACFERLNVSDPSLVESIHRGFVEAGARLVITNTFGGNRFRLEKYGMEAHGESFNHAGPVLARRAGAELVGGSMGPLGVRLAPYGRVRAEDAFEAYRRQAASLVEAGVDLLVIETQTDLLEMEQALAAARVAAPDVAAIVCATFTKDDRTLLGSTPEDVAARLGELGADAVGVNCGEGPAQALRVIRAMGAKARGLPLVARPNAGGPAEIGGRFVYPATPMYVAEHAEAFLAEGASLVGGCCGTGPQHTAAVADMLRTRVSGGGGARSRIEVVEEASPTAPDVVVIEEAAPGVRSRARPASTELARTIESGAFVIAVELEPPRSFDATKLVAAAGTLRDAGADVIDVADSPLAKMRMSAWAACRMVQERAGIETVLHFPTRGRNLLRLQADLLGAHALGIRNLFVCLGDPVTVGDFPQGSNAVDVTATGLLSLVTHGFNEGRDQGGSSIGEPTSFFAGAAVAPNATDLERECRLLARKVQAGARFLLSQPVFDVDAVRRLRRTYERVVGDELRTALFIGVLPLVTVRHAEFLHNEVPGMEIPDAARERLAKAGPESSREGLGMTSELIAALVDEGVSGVYVVPQLGRFDLAAEVVESGRRIAASG